MADGNEAVEAEEKRPQFGGRHLNKTDDVFSQNAWDNVEWSTEMQSSAEAATSRQWEGRMTDGIAKALLQNPVGKWDAFYAVHDNKFFKQRHWLANEFPELFQCTEQPLCVLEAGCGNGSTVFPLLKTSPNVFLYCCDYSRNAVETVRTSELFDPSHCSCFVWDISRPLNDVQSAEGGETKLPKTESLDIICLIFVLSAVEPAKMVRSVKNLARLLKPGGVILFRDYGRFDLSQLRFKPNRCLADNFYSRGDGTLVYYFDQTELTDLVTKAGLNCEQNIVDRRLIVNRATKVKMYRVWIQAKFRKPCLPDKQL